MAVAVRNERTESARMKEGWRNNLITSFTERFKFNNESTADVCVLVGTERIYVHKTVLELNSSILISSEVFSNKRSGKLEIDILPEFGDEVELVTNILQSFYTGFITTNQVNMKMVYKFCKCYSIRWLLDYTLPIILDTINTEDCESFIEIFKFAHTVWCSTLMEACLKKLDRDLADSLIKSDMFYRMDFYCIKTIASSESVYLPELQIFELLYKWCNNDLEQRTCHIAELLSQLQYHLIDKDNLTGQIFDWILNVSGIDEQARIQLLMRAKDGIKNSANKNQSRNLPPQIGTEEEKPEITTPENVLDQIANKLRNDNALTLEELDSVIKENIFRQADYNTQQSILDYFSIHMKLNENNVTAYLKLYEVCKQFRVISLCLQYILRSGEEYNIDTIDWKQISYSTISTIVKHEDVKARFGGYDKNKAGIRKCYCHGQRFYGATDIEMIMLWAQAHPQDKELIIQLLETVCYKAIPSKYKRAILVPYIQKLLPDHIIENLECVNHQAHTDAWSPAPWSGVELFIAKAPSKLYILQNCDQSVCAKRDDVGNVLNLCFTRTSNLRLYHQYWKRNRANNRAHEYNTKHILFDSNGAIDQYPIFRTFDSLDYIRRAIQQSGNLKVMFFTPDNSRDWKLT